MAMQERATLLALVEALNEEQLERLKFLLGERLPGGRLLPASRPELCRLLLQHFPGRALHVAADLLRQIQRYDLIRLHRLPGAEDETLGTPWETLGTQEKPPGTQDPPGMHVNPPGIQEKPPGTQEKPPEMQDEPPRLRGTPGCPPLSSLSPPHPRPPRILTEKELLQVAQKLGREWQEVGIGCLGLERSRLDQIWEENPRNVVMRSFEMLREWKLRERGGATAPRLHACLAPASLDPELLDLLQSFQRD